MDEVEFFLEHHGVKGMRWGVRKKYEKVRDKEIRRRLSVSEKKDLADNKATQAKYQAKLSKTTLNKKVIELKEDKEAAGKDDKKHLTTNQKRALVIGGSVVAAGLLAYGSYRLYETGEYNRLAMKGKALVTGKPMTWKKNPKLADPNMSPEAIFSNISTKINPAYGQPGTKNNCLRAAFAHEASRRGYDVEVTRSFKATGQSQAGIFNALTPGSKLQSASGKLSPKLAGDPTLQAFAGAFKRSAIVPDPDGSYGGKIFDALGRNPERARGSLNVFWKSGGGHVVNWEIIGGKPIIFDSQTGRMYKSAAEMINDYGDNVAGATSLRLDQLPLNNDFLMRWVKNA